MGEERGNFVVSGDQRPLIQLRSLILSNAVLSFTESLCSNIIYQPLVCAFDDL